MSDCGIQVSFCLQNEHLEGFVQVRYLMKLDFRNIYSAMVQKGFEVGPK